MKTIISSVTFILICTFCLSQNPIQTDTTITKSINSGESFELSFENSPGTGYVWYLPGNHDSTQLTIQLKNKELVEGYKPKGGKYIYTYAYTGLRNGTFFRRMYSLPGIALFCLIAFPWYLTVVTIHPGLLNYFLGNEVAGRMLTTVHHRNNTFLIYPLTLILGILPWTGYLYKSIRRSFPWKAVRKGDIPPVEVFLASWILLTLLFFCLVKSRLPLYVLNLFVPLAILTAIRLHSEPECTDQNHTVKFSKRPFFPAAVMSILLPVLSLGAAFYPTSSDLSPLTREIKHLGKSSNYHLYSTDKSLYTLAFYTGKPIMVIPDATPFLADSAAAFLVTRKDIPSNPQGKILLAAKHFKYRLYYHPGTSGNHTPENKR